LEILKKRPVSLAILNVHPKINGLGILTLIQNYIVGIVGQTKGEENEECNNDGYAISVGRIKRVYG
jgi:hypothetical protein